jgi:hypothetical protein
MTEPTPETIGDAIEQVAKNMVSSQSENGRQIQFLSVDEMIKADQHIASKRASTKPHFGMRMTKAVPPGGG